MSINDPYRLTYLKNRATWIVQQGNETFFDESRAMIEHDTAQEAIDWCAREKGAEPDFPEDEFQMALFAAGPQLKGTYWSRSRGKSI